LIKSSIIFIGSCLLVTQLFAFEIDGTKWSGAKADIYVAIDGSSPSGVLWNTAFIGAIQDWNQSTDFTFSVFEEAADPCGFDSRNGVGFTSDVCGSAFGENTLAVTLTRFSSQVLGPPAIIRTDIVINDSVKYDIFDGRLVQLGIPFGSIDFRRVALHELGHAMGLDHEFSVAAIMAPRISSIDSLQEDDIAGINTLYGGLENCSIAPLRFGTTANSLSFGDCIVRELTVGGTDTSFIDLFRFDLERTTTVKFEMESQQLDSVLILATTDLEYLNLDPKTSNLCGSTLAATLQAGSYFLLGNTFVEPVKEACGNTGNYILKASFTSSQPNSLGASTSNLGAPSRASFSGGVSDNNGQGFGNKFPSSSSLDIQATITVDPLHVGEPGFLVAAAAFNDQLLFLNSAGIFVDAPAIGFINAASKLLSPLEELVLADDLVPADLGIETIEVDFFVGYGLNAQPNEIFFHQKPINLLISP
jgi:predicted Zn-dependent protease